MAKAPDARGPPRRRRRPAAAPRGRTPRRVADRRRRPSVAPKLPATALFASCAIFGALASASASASASTATTAAAGVGRIARAERRPPVRRVPRADGEARREMEPSRDGAPGGGVRGGDDESRRQPTGWRTRRRRAQEQERGNADLEATKKEYPRQYRLLSYGEIVSKLRYLADRYPSFVSLTSAQEAFGLPSAGGADDCPSDHDRWDRQDQRDNVFANLNRSSTVSNGTASSHGSGGCKNWILTVEDSVAHPRGSRTWRVLPEVFLSGSLHGNERVGPTAVVEAAELMLEAAACEALPRTEPGGGNVGGGDGAEEGSPGADVAYGRSNPVFSARDEELHLARLCRSDLARRGVGPSYRRWLARLVTTRRTVVVPAANALGYYRNRREEGNVDPNRDFPYDLKDPTLCMRTIAGRTINEVFRAHMFQLSLTFHAGMEAVAYEWGNPSYLGYASPDDVAQSEIASGYSRYGGGWANTKPYPAGTLNDLVYYVRGGMEDWAYAGSWDPQLVVRCDPAEYGGYDKEKTAYDNSTLRAFNMLVETSNSKNPAIDSLGTSEDVLGMGGSAAGNGHVARNVRLSLLAVDLVEPYASIVGINGAVLTDDVVPSTNRTGRSCWFAKAARVPGDGRAATVEWTVGGGFTVERTWIVHARWADLPWSVDGSTHPAEDELTAAEAVFSSGLAESPVSAATARTGAQASFASGRTRWHERGPHPDPSESETGGGDDSDVLGPVFRAAVDTGRYEPGDWVAVFAAAQLDPSWSNPPGDGRPVAPTDVPQSHAVNARTNPNWNHEQRETGKVVRGRLDWYSIPLTLVIGEEGRMDTVILDRFRPGWEEEGGTKPPSSSSDPTGGAGDSTDSSSSPNGDVGGDIPILPDSSEDGAKAADGAEPAAPNVTGTDESYNMTTHAPSDTMGPTPVADGGASRARHAATLVAALTLFLWFGDFAARFFA